MEINRRGFLEKMMVVAGAAIAVLIGLPVVKPEAKVIDESHWDALKQDHQEFKITGTTTITNDDLQGEYLVLNFDSVNTIKHEHL